MYFRLISTYQLCRWCFTSQCLLCLGALSCSKPVTEIQALGTPPDASKPLEPAFLISKASASNLDPYVAITCELANQSSTMNDKLQVKVQVQPSPTFYLYQSVRAGSAFSPLTFSLECTDGSVIQPECSYITHPREMNGSKVFDQPFMAVLSLPLKRIADSQDLKLHMDYQACNDLMCLPPNRITTNLSFEVTEL